MTRSIWVAATVLGVSLVALGAFADRRPVLVWNASPSVPVGLYVVAPVRALAVGELVVIRPPPALAVWLAGRRYLALGVPLLKHVAALPGQRVCRIGRAILIQGAPSGLALDGDRRGRPLPVWRGCQLVSSPTVLVMNAAPDSLDGRYFGPLPRAGIVGRALPLWTLGRP